MTTTALAGVVMIVLIFGTLALGFPIGLSIGIGSAAALCLGMNCSCGKNTVNDIYV